jgi:hypothetical protein
MTRLRLQHGGEVALACAGFVAVIAAVVLLVEGVEQARELAGVGGREWLRQVAARWPGQVVATLPIAGALAAAWVTAVWRRGGRLVAVQACGISPASLCVTSFLGVLFVALGVLGAREAVAWPVCRVLAGQGSWTAMGIAPGSGAGDADRVMLRAERLLEREARGVEVAWLAAGRLVGRASAATAPTRSDGTLREGRSPSSSDCPPRRSGATWRWRRVPRCLSFDCSRSQGLRADPLGSESGWGRWSVPR